MSVHLQQPEYHLWAYLGPKTADVCPEPDRREFSAVNSRKAPEANRMFVAWSLHHPGAELPERPAPQED